MAWDSRAPWMLPQPRPCGAATRYLLQAPRRTHGGRNLEPQANCSATAPNLDGFSMSSLPGLAALADGTILSPFSRLRHLLDGIAPGNPKTIDLTLGEPRETMPTFVAEKIREAEALFAKYPPIRGSDELRSAIAAWIGRRYRLDGVVDPATEILPCNGSREGLFYAAFPAVGRKPGVERPAILMCNPYYQAYLGAALAAGAEPVFLNATEATGHLPDLDEIAGDEALLTRTVAFYLCSPANPQGAVASEAYIRARARPGPRLRLHAVLRRMLFGDLLRCGPDRRARGCSQNARALPQPRRLQLALEALEPARAALGLLGRRRRLSRYAVRGAQSRRAADAGADATRLRGRLVGGAARHLKPAGLPAEIRCRGRGLWGPLRLPAARPAASFFGST